MRIKDLNLKSMEDNNVYQYIDENNQEIVMVKIKDDTIMENTGYYLIIGEVKFNDGTTYPAVFGISSDDSGEMFEYHFLTEKGWISSSEDVCNLLNKKKSEVFPFKYRLNCVVSGDIHIDEQYWPR